jgi:CO/xanthine dehydrogenase Mo-binding subunit
VSVREYAVLYLGQRPPAAATAGGGNVVLVGEPVATAHLADPVDAHDASAISLVDAGGLFVSTDVEAALAELAGMGGSPNLEGGSPTSTYGGTTAIDGGTP